jgi:signal transduction histidine kinase
VPTSSEDDACSSEQRQQTDESLRAEREKADEALGDELAASDETADAVISRARARADAVLAAARAKTDRRSSRAPSGQLPQIQRERLLEDRALEEERAGADEILRVERAEHVALLALERDETDKDLSSERSRSDGAIATRDEFLGIVSHDLRNMLNAISLGARLIAEAVQRADHVEQVCKHAQRIERASARMDRLIGDLVDVSGIEAGALSVTRELVDPSEVVSEAVHSFQAQASAASISLVAETGPSSLRVALDPARILQVLVNLISNALKCTPAGGEVRVHVEPIGDQICFEVRDTGAGIPLDKLEAVFGRFVQVIENDRRGSGLGLYISRCIVQGHGGRIWAESKLGAGSTFRFTLPVGD